MSHPDRPVDALPRPLAEPDPRRARSQDRLLDAATELLASGGVEAVTVDSVTRRSGVARTTLYRNFGNITELLASAFERLIPPIEPAPRTASLREQLVEVLVRKTAAFERAPLHWALLTWSGLQRTTNSADASSPAAETPATQALRARLLSHYRQPFDSILNSAEGRAELGELDTTLAVAQLLGPLVFLQLSGQRPTTTTDCEHIVDSFLAAHAGK
ncbi:MAG: TetR/AcrR family transcriptional regulator [Microlunatus sp.]|nr:TetR/AcrR family transcriptional regulator [Microlunatus sp.]